MINVYSDELGRAMSFAAHDRNLTTEEKALLLEELTEDPAGKGYANYISNPAALIPLLAQPYSISNPNPRELVPKSIWARQELYDRLLECFSTDGLPFFISLKMESLHTDPERSINAQMVELTLNSPLPYIDFNHPMIESSIELLIEHDILTEEDHTNLTQELDPTWQSIIQMPSRLQAIGLGEGAVVGVRDIQEVLNG